MLGHSKLETTQIYTQVSILKLQEIHQATHPAKVGKARSLAERSTDAAELFSELDTESDED